MATETDAARDRVLAARAAFGEALDTLEASARAAVDIPAKIRRSPAKAAAVAGSAGFLVLGGPRRLFRAADRAVRGPTAGLPKRMLPDEIEKTLRKLGDDGEKVRGTLERDFANYAKQTAKDNPPVPTMIATTIARPLLRRGLKAAGEWFLSSDDEGFAARLAQVRERTRRQAVSGTAEDAVLPGSGGDGDAGQSGA